MASYAAIAVPARLNAESWPRPESLNVSAGCASASRRAAPFPKACCAFRADNRIDNPKGWRRPLLDLGGPVPLTRAVLADQFLRYTPPPNDARAGRARPAVPGRRRVRRFASPR